MPRHHAGRPPYLILLLAALTALATAQPLRAQGGRPTATALRLDAPPSAVSSGALACRVGQTVTVQVVVLDAYGMAMPLSGALAASVTDTMVASVSRSSAVTAALDVHCLTVGRTVLRASHAAAAAEMKLAVSGAVNASIAMKSAASRLGAAAPPTSAVATRTAGAPAAATAGMTKPAVLEPPVTLEVMQPTLATASFPPVVPATGFTGIAGPKYAQLQWTAPRGAFGYVVHRFDFVTQQHLTLRAASGDTLLHQTTVTDTTVQLNIAYGYRLLTYFPAPNGTLVAAPDTGAGVLVTARDPNAPLELAPGFATDSMRITFTSKDTVMAIAGDFATMSLVTFNWDWRYGAEGFRFDIRALPNPWQQADWNGHLTDIGNSGLTPYSDVSITALVSTHSSYLVCLYAASHRDPVLKRRIESPPAVLRLERAQDHWTAQPWNDPPGLWQCPGQKPSGW